MFICACVAISQEAQGQETQETQEEGTQEGAQGT
jgi:hypothetical protein